MLRNRRLIIGILLALALVVIYDVYYFTAAKKPPPQSAASATPQQPREAPRLGLPQPRPDQQAGGRPRIAGDREPGRRPSDEGSAPKPRTGAPAAESSGRATNAKSDEEFAHILTRIEQQPRTQGKLQITVDPFRALPDEAPSVSTTELQTQTAAEPTLDSLRLDLTAIFIGAGVRIAVINGQEANEGDQIDGVTVRRIAEDSVLMEKEGAIRVLSLMSTPS